MSVRASLKMVRSTLSKDHIPRPSLYAALQFGQRSKVKVKDAKMPKSVFGPNSITAKCSTTVSVLFRYTYNNNNNNMQISIPP